MNFDPNFYVAKVDYSKVNQKELCRKIGFVQSSLQRTMHDFVMSSFCRFDKSSKLNAVTLKQQRQAQNLYQRMELVSTIKRWGSR